LADEAGLVLTQYWSVRKREIQRDELIEELKKAKEQTVTTNELFTIQWEII